MVGLLLEQPVIDESRLTFANLATFAEQPLPPGPWYLHIDADLLDPTAVPPLRRAVPDGPTLQEVADALRPLTHNPMLAAIGLVCSFTPPTLREATALRPFLSLTDRLL